MNFNKFNLFLTAILVILLYFTIPFYNLWLFTKVYAPGNNIFDQMQNQDVQYRKEYRFGGSFMAYEDMQRKLSKYQGVTLLLIPTDYLRAQGINDIDMTEPAEFYYFTGINAVWANSPDAASATWAVIASKQNGIGIKKIKSKADLDTLLTVYKHYIK